MRGGNDAQDGSPRLFSARRTTVRWIVSGSREVRTRASGEPRSLELVLEYGNVSGSDLWEMVIPCDTPRCVRIRL